jgi:hypothetical protein
MSQPRDALAQPLPDGQEGKKNVGVDWRQFTTAARDTIGTPYPRPLGSSTGCRDDPWFRRRRTRRADRPGRERHGKPASGVGHPGPESVPSLHAKGVAVAPTSHGARRIPQNPPASNVETRPAPTRASRRKDSSRGRACSALAATRAARRASRPPDHPPAPAVPSYRFHRSGVRYPTPASEPARDSRGHVDPE